MIEKDRFSGWGIEAGLPDKSEGEVYITCLKHSLMSLLRSTPNPAITPQVQWPVLSEYERYS